MELLLRRGTLLALCQSKPLALRAYVIKEDYSLQTMDKMGRKNIGYRVKQLLRTEDSTKCISADNNRALFPSTLT